MNLNFSFLLAPYKSVIFEVSATILATTIVLFFTLSGEKVGLNLYSLQFIKLFCQQ